MNKIIEMFLKFIIASYGSPSTSRKASVSNLISASSSTSVYLKPLYAKKS
jgi:hypothetical protein